MLATYIALFATVWSRYNTQMRGATADSNKQLICTSNVSSKFLYAAVLDSAGSAHGHG